MAKSPNYTKAEFDIIQSSLKKLPKNNIAKFETLAAELNREVWSLYCFILRKLDLDIFTDRAIKKAFRKKYCKSNRVPKKDKKTYSNKKIIRSAKKDENRPPAVYSNFDWQKWKDSLLND